METEIATTCDGSPCLGGMPLCIGFHGWFAKRRAEFSTVSSSMVTISLYYYTSTHLAIPSDLIKILIQSHLIFLSPSIQRIPVFNNVQHLGICSGMPLETTTWRSAASVNPLSSVTRALSSSCRATSYCGGPHSMR